ncbi:MAG: 4'-phosphopantetheinyl transferase superfamily protein [Clostridia bacterium]|nr:4'-phosphopantetheinyl transferase superfamily protein [Clostridia bacterium]
MNIGIDIVDCERVAGIVNEKVFSAEELTYIEQKKQALPTIAGLCAAKEAYFKAKGTGIIKSELPKIVVGHDENGQPFFFYVTHAMLSISHTGAIALAVCIIF